MAILRLPAHNLHAAFLLTRVVTLHHLASSSPTVPVPSVRALVTSLLHLFYFIRYGPGLSLSLSVFWGLPVYPNKIRPADTLDPERSSFIYHLTTGHGSSFQGNIDYPRSEVPGNHQENASKRVEARGIAAEYLFSHRLALDSDGADGARALE